MVSTSAHPAVGRALRLGSTVVVDETGRQEAAVLPLSRLTDAVSLVEGCRHAADQEEVADPEFPHQPQVRAVVGTVISERNLTTNRRCFSARYFEQQITPISRAKEAAR